MKSEKLAALVAISCSLLTLQALAQSPEWRSFGPSGGNIRSLAVDPQDGTTLYVGANGGVYKSTAGGSAWSNVNGEIGKAIVRRLTINPTDPSHLLAETITPFRRYSSRDGGETWERVTEGFFALGGVVFDPVDSSILYSVGQTLNRSSDGGATWEKADEGLPPYSSTGPLAIAPSQPDRLFVVVSGRGVFRSLDGGATWQPTALEEDLLHTLAVDPADPDVVFARNFDVVYRSVDGGRSWSLVLERTRLDLFYDLVLDPRGSGATYVVTRQRILVSVDRGARWTQFGDTLPERPVELAITGDGIFYLSTTCGVFRTDASGVWQSASGRLLATDVRAVEVAAANPGILYAGTLQCGIFRSVDAGVRWQRLPAPGIYRRTLDVATDPAAPEKRLYVSTVEGIFGTVDGGVTWRPYDFSRSTEDPPGNTATSIQVAVAASDPRRVYAVREGQLFRSDDRGKSFSRVPIELSVNHGISSTKSHTSTQITVDPEDASTVYAAQGRFLLKTTDAGRAWQITGEGLTSPKSVVIDSRETNTLYAFSDDGFVSETDGIVFKSIDGGATWEPASESFPKLSTLAVDPRTPQAVYAGTLKDGVFASFDGAGTWQSLGDDTALDFITTLSASATAIYAGTFRGVLELPKRCAERIAPEGEPVVIGAGSAPQVVADGAGRFFTVWTAPGGEAYARAVDAGGQVVGTPFRLGGDDDNSPAVAADGPGEVLAVWRRDPPGSSAVRARLYSVGGDVRGAPVRVDREPNRVKRAPAVARTRVGEAVVVWESVSVDQRSLIRAQRLNARGIATTVPITVRGGADRVFAPAVSTDAFGRFTIAWLESQAQELSVRMRSYRVHGTPRGSVVRLSDPGASVVEASPRLAVALTGETVAVWLEQAADGTRQITARWLRASGAATGEQRFDLGGTTGSPVGFDVVIDRFGNTLLVWSTEGAGVRSRVFDVSGQPKSDELQVSQGGSPSVALDLAGRAVVVWEDGGTILAQRLRLECAP